MTDSHSFPHPQLTKIDREPTNTSYRKLLVEVYENAMSVLSTRGGGDNGMLGAVTTPEEYQLEAPGATPWEDPPNPGPTPPELGANPTSPQITENNRQYKVDVEAYCTHRDTMSAIRKQIVEAIEDDFICELCSESVGYQRTTVLELLTHISTTYSAITPEELTVNEKDMEREWDTASMTIELLFKRVAACRRLAERGNDPITDITTIRKTLAVIEKTGQFEKPIEDWRAIENPANKTWTAFRRDFKKADKERKRKITAQTGGYAGANLTTAGNQPVESANLTVGAMENNIRLQIRAEQAEEALQAFITNDQPWARGGRGGGRGGTVQQATGTNTAQWTYCWSHGLQRPGNTNAHDSQGCPFKMDGHKVDATIEDMKGGSAWIQRSLNSAGKKDVSAKAHKYTFMNPLLRKPPQAPPQE
jgi:hypothetical protein